MKQLVALLWVALLAAPLYSQEICDNGIDDDGDGLIDCLDPDCHSDGGCEYQFICNPDAFLFQNSVTDVYRLTVASGEATLEVDNLVDGQRMNGIGYNVKDGCIWGGVPTQPGKVGRVRSDYVTQFFEIPGLPEKKYYVGDVDTSGVLVLYHSSVLYRVDVNPWSNDYLTLLSSTGCSPGKIHDWVFNPVDRQLYAVEKGTNKLKKIDPETGAVTDYGLIPELNGINSAYGAIYTDLLGNMFVSTNKTGNIWRINQVHNVTQNSEIDCSLFSLGPASNQNDGCMCSLTTVPIEICGNGTDDDGDGLVDCDDPACWQDSGCEEICGDGFDNDGDGLVDLNDPDVDADGDGICVDTDPDDNDACNPNPSVGCLQGQCGTNIAGQGTATQSSTDADNTTKWGPDNAIDGNTAGNQNNMSLTQSELNAWWELDLGSEEQIDEIRIWNRTDAYPERLEQFYVFISSTPFASTDLATTVADGNVTTTYVANSPDAFVIIQPGITGRYLRVQHLNQEQLQIAEFEVLQYSDTSTPEYNTLGSWDDHGVPNYLNNDYNGSVDADLLEDLNYMFSYGHDLYTKWPHITQVGQDRHIELTAETCLNLTMIASALTQDEALAYYTYPVGSPPTSLDNCDLTIVTPNLGNEAWSNGVDQGDQIDLGTFSAGTAIGFVILHQSWNGTTNNLDAPQYTFASEASLNPETNYPDHIFAVADDAREMIHFAVEGGLTPEISVQNTDKDFADLFFSVEACDYDAIDTEDMPGTLYTTIGCNSVPTGLTVTNIGLWRGTLQWNDLVGADNYRIRFREYASGDAWEYRNMGTSTSYTVDQYNASIKPGTMYEWQVASTCEGVQTSNSVINVFETLYPCEMPSSSWLTDVTATSVRVNWTSVNYATNYQIAYYETGDELNTQWRNAGGGTYFDITGLEPNTEYNYQVGAFCEEYPSCMHPYLNAISFTTLADGGIAPPMDSEYCVELRSEANFELAETISPTFEGDVQADWYDVSGTQGLVVAQPDGGAVLTHITLDGVSSAGSETWNVFPYTHMDVRNLDGAGTSEVVLTNGTASSADVFGWDGGAFRRQAVVEQHADAGFNQAVFAQLDTDLPLELVAINPNANKLQIFEPELLDAREDEDLVYRYVPGERLIAYDSPIAVQAFDLNADGLDEIGVRHLGEDFLTVHYNGEAADSLHFTKIPCLLEGPATGFDTGLMTSDMATEIALISADGQTLEIYAEIPNAVGPGIGKQLNVVLEGTPAWVTLVDVDANGRTDVLVGLADQAGMVLYQSLSASQVIVDEGIFLPLPQTTTACLQRDLDGDNLPDLVLTGTDGTLYVYRNTTVSDTELSVVTTKQATGAWNGTLNDTRKDASYHWEYWNGEQYLPLFNTEDKVVGAQSASLTLNADQEQVVRCVETRPCGTIRKSSPLVVGGELSNWKVLVNPNITPDQTVVRTVNPVFGTVELDVLSLSGRVVYRETLRHQSGPLNHELALRDIPPGTYLVRVRNNTGAGVERLVIQK